MNVLRLELKGEIVFVQSLDRAHLLLHNRLESGRLTHGHINIFNEGHIYLI